MIHLQELKGSVPKPVCEESGEKSPALRSRGCAGDTSGVVGDPEPSIPQGVAALAPHNSPGDVLVPACSWATHHGHLAAEGQQGHTHG